MFSLQVQLQKQGYCKGFSVKDVVNKIKKLRQKYKTEKDKKRRSGTNRAKEWKFFTKMDGFMSQKHNVNPPLVTDTMAEQEAQNTCKFRQDINCIPKFSFLF